MQPAGLHPYRNESCMQGVEWKVFSRQCTSATNSHIAMSYLFWKPIHRSQEWYKTLFCCLHACTKVHSRLLVYTHGQVRPEQWQVAKKFYK